MKVLQLQVDNVQESGPKKLVLVPDLHSEKAQMVPGTSDGGMKEGGFRLTLLLLCLPEDSEPTQKQRFCSGLMHQRGPGPVLNAIATLSSGSDLPETF